MKTTQSTEELIRHINDADVVCHGGYYKLVHLGEEVLSLVPCLSFVNKAPVAALRVNGGLHLVNIVIQTWVHMDRNNSQMWADIDLAIKNKFAKASITVIATANRGGRMSHWNGGHVYGIGQTPLIQLLRSSNGTKPIMVASRELWVDALVETLPDYARAIGECFAQYLFNEETRPVSIKTTTKHISYTNTAAYHVPS